MARPDEATDIKLHCSVEFTLGDVTYRTPIKALGLINGDCVSVVVEDAYIDDKKVKATVGVTVSIEGQD